MTEQNFVGRRKTSVARVIMKSGTGKVDINGKPMSDFFNQQDNREDVLLPFNLTQTAGPTGQSQAIRLAISKALLDINPEFRAILKPVGLLMRDPRMVERKKYGRPKARKRFQFSKR